MTNGFFLAGLFVVVAAAIARFRYARQLEREIATRLPLGSGGVVRGAEPFELPREGGPAVLLLHGGGDTPQTLRYLAEHLHRSGFAVSAPLLPGHGRTLSEFGRSTAEAWFEAARAAYQAILRQHEWVGMVGLSMGGALAVRLAAETPTLPALALLAPYLAMPSGVARIARVAPLWGLALPYVRSTRGRSIHDEVEAQRSLAYGAFAAPALRALYDTVRLARAALPAVRAPTLVVQSRADNRIAVADAQAAFDLIGAEEKRLLWLEGSGHVITVDYERERVSSAVSEWLLAHRRVARPAREA